MQYAQAMQILREWRLFAPALVHHGGKWHVVSRSSVLSSGATIEAALIAAGYTSRREDAPLPFVAVNSNVVQGEAGICSARSKTMALRIANALNEYLPGDRGF